MLQQQSITGGNTRLKIITWHIHGSYLYYLSQGNYDLYIPVKDDRSEGYYGRGETFLSAQMSMSFPLIKSGSWILIVSFFSQPGII
ncbi:hypothetical protein [Arcticibacter tournemirensis]|uniref:hypothetical protein n=1 Tax=Arcticibacter tournemirensis TaxID=699437 RepID=UPI001F3AD6D9|nr:hypothetical protein [Arcticibacter tournemirensis]